LESTANWGTTSFQALPVSTGTENIYKIYTESFKGKDHLKQIQEEAQAIVNKAFQKAGSVQ